MDFGKASRRAVCGLLCLSALYAFQRPFRQFPGVEYYTFELTPDWQEKTEFAFARLMFPPGPLNGYRGRDAEWHHIERHAKLARLGERSLRIADVFIAIGEQHEALLAGLWKRRGAETDG